MTRCIYALLDPDTEEVRYVGQTMMTPSRRLKGHCKKTQPPVTPRDFWVNSLIAQGKKPRMSILEEDADLNAETRWIAHYQHQGIPLTHSASRAGETMIRAPKTTKDKVLKLAREESLRSGRSVSMAEIVDKAIDAFIAMRETQN
jgi:hypothetical protein